GVKRSTLEGERQRQEKIDAIEAGFEAARAKDTALRKIAAIAAVPLRMLEAWALADPDAIEALGGDRDAVPTSPETMWGKKQDPHSDYPKHVLCRALGGREPNRDDFARIAEVSSLTQLQR